MRFFSPLLIALLYILALFPLRLIYAVSGLLFRFANLFSLYRRKVVVENLRIAFPSRENTFYQDLTSRFYKHFSQVNAEILKIPLLRASFFERRVSFTNPELLTELLNEHAHVLAVTSHMNNWEWGGLALAGAFPGTRIQGIYKPLSNSRFDAYFRKIRSKFGMRLVPMKSALRAVAGTGKERTVTVLISDQSPMISESELVAPFFNTPVPVYLGAEKLARLTGYPVIYFAMRKIRRGFYKVEIIPVSLDPKSEPLYEITLRHLAILENEIMGEPAHWLWTHRRWKHAGKTIPKAAVAG